MFFYFYDYNVEWPMFYKVDLIKSLRTFNKKINRKKGSVAKILSNDTIE